MGIRARVELCEAGRLGVRIEPHGIRKIRREPVSFGPSLFDNCIGRKRDVGGVVLAGALASGLFGVSRAGRGFGVLEETTDGHVSE